MKPFLWKLFYILMAILVALFFAEISYASEIINDVTKKPTISQETNPSNISKAFESLGFHLYESRWSLFFISLMATSLILIALYAPDSTPPRVDPRIYEMPRMQEMIKLLEFRPDVTMMHPAQLQRMPETLDIVRSFKYDPLPPGFDPNLIAGFISNDGIGYRMYLMPDAPFADLTARFWVDEACRLKGTPIFPSNDFAFMYTRVAIIPPESLNYAIYHKVDIVRVIADPGHPSIPVPIVSTLFKDNEAGWFQ